MNKKAMELSINFIVMLIIALAVFGMGLMLFRQFFIEAENIKQNLDEQTKAELTQKMMSSSEQVIVYPTQLTVSKNKGDAIGVGILNIGTNTDFWISAAYGGKCYDSQGKSITDCGAADAITSVIPRRVTVMPNKREIFELPFRVSGNAKSAKYAITVTVSQPQGTPISTNIVYIKVS